MSQVSVSQSGDDQGSAALRAQFDAEVLAADLTVPDADREALFAMWVEHLALRDSLRTARVALEEEPSFMEQPARLGAGVVMPRAGTPTSGGTR